MIRRVFPLGLGIVMLAASAAAGERAQTSGARKTGDEEKKASPPPTEAERVSLLNRILRDRQFDIFKSSVGGAIDAPIPSPSSSAPIIDPKTQKRLLEEVDRKKNWLVEPGNTTPRELERVADPNAVPDFSRDRSRYSTYADPDKQPEFSTKSGRKLPGVREESDMGNRSGAGKQSEPGNIDLRESLSDESHSESTSKDYYSADWGTGRGSKDDSLGSRSGTTERLAGTFDFGGGRTVNDFGTAIGSDSTSFGSVGGAKEFLNPFSDPSKAQALGNDPFSDPGQRLDPTVSPQSAFGIRDDAFAKIESLAPAAAAAPAAAGFGGFGVQAPSVGAGINSFLNTPAPEPARAQQPTFVPRPAVLGGPSANPF